VTVSRTRPEQTVGPAAAWRVLRQRDFALYFTGNAASASGTWFQNLAASLLVYRLTHSAFLLGVLNFGQFIPVLLLSPWAGAVADRFDRRVVTLVAQSVAATLSTILAVLAWSGRVDEWTVIAFTLGAGITSAFSAPAQLALITSLVDEPDVPQAVALNSMTFNLARAIGPALAALAIATLGIPAAFLLNAFSYLVLVVALLLVHPRPQQRAERPRVRESLHLLRADPRLAVYLLIVMSVGFASDPVNTESPAFANEFGKPDTWAGALIGAFGAGAVTAAFLVAGRVEGSRTRMALTLALCGGGIVAYCLTPWFLLALVPLFVAGFGYLASNTSATSRLQLGVAEHQRGRIMALWSIAFLGLRPFASIVDGALAAAFGVRVAGIVLALPALVGALVIMRTLRR
jgi:MFS family permease